MCANRALFSLYSEKPNADSLAFILQSSLRCALHRLLTQAGLGRSWSENGLLMRTLTDDRLSLWRQRDNDNDENQTKGT